MINKAASWHCFFLVEYSLPVSSCRTFEFVINITMFGSANGMSVDVRDLFAKRIIMSKHVLNSKGQRFMFAWNFTKSRGNRLSI